MKVLIDTDAGLDDAISLLLAINLLPKGSVLAVTSVFGNVDLHQVNYNLKEILAVTKEPTIPIYSGASEPIVSSVGEKWHGHGVDGLGGAIGIAPFVPAGENEAVKAMSKLARQYPQELTIVCIGPATNIALAATLDPSFVANVKEVIFMGCTLRGMGNTTPHAEFNVASDPEAAHILLSKFADKLTVVSWETVYDAHLTWTFYDELVSAPTPTAEFIKRICSAYVNLRPKDNEEAVPDMNATHTFVLCDAYAMALLLEDYTTECSFAVGTVELSHGETRGSCYWKKVENGTRGVKLVHSFDISRFQAILAQLVHER
ncbi:hypothetical protein THRCLA_03640 [Thraustotheca clavata]|uniref:Inosine/uridine-preferring nucleoside hydrolase domain-containing protein n=1 Tax=Thraustotheca clavata TaxID=74557 RepID=A0A1W0A1D8_9STRA|nr:hypothetical protein THRCLA_03640 [Thraustotheca clavata]